MIKELPESARKCTLNNIFVTEDAKVFSKGKTGFKELSVREDKKGTKKFYYSGDKKYHSLVQAYAEAFVPNTANKPLAFIMDSDKGFAPDNILWATNDEWLEYWKAHTKRICKCCGGTMDNDMVGVLCRQCFRSMAEMKPDSAEIKRFQERIAVTGFDPDTDRFSGRQRDALELYCSGEPLAKIASVLGCDMKTASACIKSAKTARTLERMSVEHVTEIGYKSLADIVPADAELASEEQLASASAEVEAAAEVIETAEEVTETAEPEKSAKAPGESPVPLASITVVMRDNNSVETGRDIIPIVEKQECSKPRVLGNVMARSVINTDNAREWDIPVFKSDDTALNENNIMSSGSMQVLPESVFNETVTAKSVEAVVTVSEPESIENVQHKNESELDKLFRLYKRDILGVDFATYCKVYWLACRYTGEYARALATVTIRFMSKKHYSFNVSNINYMLRTGMEAIGRARYER